MKKLKMHSPNFTEENIAGLAELFPNCVTEAQEPQNTQKEENNNSVSSACSVVKKVIDWDLLKQELSEHIVEGAQERYHLNWPGKREALLAANKPIDRTLRPCREESVDFDTTENLFIEGDNLNTLKLLQETYLGKVKMIYIDPPYNTGKDFIYKDNFRRSAQEELEESGQVDEEGNRLVANTDSNGRFHSDWLSMMYPRLKLARNLLKDDGVIFVSIDDNEVSNLRKLCDEIFGEENFVGDIIRKTKSTTNDKKHGFNIQHENVLIYAKLIDVLILQGDEKDLTKYKNPDNDPRGTWVIADPSARTGHTFPIENPHTGKIDYPPENRQWLFSGGRFKEYLEEGRIVFKTEHKENERGFIFKRYANELRTSFNQVNSLFGLDNQYMNQSATKAINKLFPDFKPFDYSKPTNFIYSLIKFTARQDDLILDFFAGSSTTAHAVMQLNAEDGGNRKFIMVQLPEPCDEKSEAYKAGYKTIAEIAKERIHRAAAKIKEENPEYDGDLGFKVFKLDSTNIKPWEVDFDMTERTLEDFISNIKPGRSEEDVTYEILLKYGLLLDLPIEKKRMKTLSLSLSQLGRAATLNSLFNRYGSTYHMLVGCYFS